MRTSLLLLSMFIMKVSFCQQYDLRLKLMKDSTYYSNVSGNSKMNEIVEGRELNIDFTYDCTAAFHITAFKENAYSADISYTNLKMSIGVGGKQLVFNSAEPKAEDKISPVLAMLINHPFHAEMTAKGELTSIENIDALFSDMTDKIPDLDAAQKQKILQQLLKAYGAKAFLGNFNMLINIYPQKKVSKNESWVINTPLESGLAAALRTTYTLSSVTKDSYSITAKAELKTADKDAYMDLNGLNVKYDLTGDMSSALTISKNTGWITEGKIIQKMSGKADVEKSADLPNGITIPMQFDGLINVSNIDAAKLH